MCFEGKLVYEVNQFSLFLNDIIFAVLVKLKKRLDIKKKNLINYFKWVRCIYDFLKTGVY